MSISRALCLLLAFFTVASFAKDIPPQQIACKHLNSLKPNEKLAVIASVAGYMSGKKAATDKTNYYRDDVFDKAVKHLTQSCKNNPNLKISAVVDKAFNIKKDH